MRGHPPDVQKRIEEGRKKARDIPRVFDGHSVFVIGGGPSLCDFDWGLISDRYALGVNDAYLLGSWVDVCCYGDEVWLRSHENNIVAWPGLVIGLTPNPSRCIKVRWMPRDPMKINAPDSGCCGWFHNTGQSAINLAAILGAKRILLLGFDMKLGEDDDGNPLKNWHTDRLSSPDPDRYPIWMKNGENLKKQMDEVYPDVEVLNCNPDSAWDDFRKVKLEDVL